MVGREVRGEWDPFTTNFTSYSRCIHAAMPQMLTARNFRLALTHRTVTHINSLLRWITLTGRLQSSLRRRYILKHVFNARNCSVCHCSYSVYEFHEKKIQLSARPTRNKADLDLTLSLLDCNIAHEFGVAQFKCISRYHVTVRNADTPVITLNIFSQSRMPVTIITVARADIVIWIWWRYCNILVLGTRE